MEAQKEIVKLFTDEWMLKDIHKGQVFNFDGIVNDKYWNEEKNKRILFFLKEAHQGNRSREEYGKDVFDLVGWLDGTVYKMWKKVAIWVAAIENTTISNIKEYNESEISKIEQELIRKIAVVNVKKSNGKTNSKWEELVDYAKEDKELLFKEIRMIKPKVIICGNNVSLLNIVFDGGLDLDKLYKHHYLLHDEYIILDYYHPACHYPNFVNYYAVASLYQQALKNMK